MEDEDRGLFLYLADGETPLATRRQVDIVRMILGRQHLRDEEIKKVTMCPRSLRAFAPRLDYPSIR